MRVSFRKLRHRSDRFVGRRPVSNGLVLPINLANSAITSWFSGATRVCRLLDVVIRDTGSVAKWINPSDQACQFCANGSEMSEGS